MKNRRIKTVGLMLLAALMLTGLNAQSFRNNGMSHRQNRMSHRQDRMTYQNRMAHQDRVADRFSLDLSEEQKEEFKTIRSEHYIAIKPLRNKMAELKANEHTLMSEPEVDLKAVNKIVDEQTELMNKIKKLQVEQRLSAKEILTDEQIMKLEQRRRISKYRKSNGNDFHRPPRKGRPHHRNMG